MDPTASMQAGDAEGAQEGTQVHPPPGGCSLCSAPLFFPESVAGGSLGEVSGMSPLLNQYQKSPEPGLLSEGSRGLWLQTGHGLLVCSVLMFRN